MLDVILHIIGGALIAFFGFLAAFVTGLPEVGAFVAGSLVGLFREHEQHNGGNIFDFSWITPSRLLEGVAWGIGAALMALIA